MTENTPPKPGSVSSILGRLASLAMVRAEMFGLELQERKEAMLANMILAFVAFGALLIALLAGLLCIAALTPPAWRAAVMGAIALLALAVAAGTLWGVRRRLQALPEPFALTLSEIRKDCDTLLRRKD